MKVKELLAALGEEDPEGEVAVRIYEPIMPAGAGVPCVERFLEWVEVWGKRVVNEKKLAEEPARTVARTRVVIDAG